MKTSEKLLKRYEYSPVTILEPDGMVQAKYKLVRINTSKLNEEEVATICLGETKKYYGGLDKRQREG